MEPPLEQEREPGITVSAKATSKGIILTGRSFTAFSTHADLMGGKEKEKQLPPGSTLQLSSGGETQTTHEISHIRLQAAGSVIHVLGIKQDGKEVDLSEYEQRGPAAKQQTIEKSTGEFSLLQPVALGMGSSGELELAGNLKSLFQQLGIMSALFTGQPVFVAVPENSTIRMTRGEDPVNFTKCTLQLVGTSITVISVARGERSIFRQAASGIESGHGPTTPPPLPETKAGHEKGRMPSHPLIQTVGPVERELRILLQQLAEHMERVRAQKAKEHGDSLVQKAEQAVPWPTQLLRAIERKAQEFEDALHKANFTLPAPQVTRTVGYLGKLVGHEILETTINPTETTFVASALLEILQTGTVCGQRVPPELRDAVRTFIQTIAQRKQIGEGPYAATPSKQVSRFGKFAEGRYEFGGVQDEEQLGFTDRRKTWKQLQALLASDTAPHIAKVSAFQQVTQRMVPDSTSARAPGHDAGEDARKDHDRTLLATIQTARNSQFYRTFTAEEQRAFDAQCAKVTANIAKRGLIPVDVQWISTEAARMRSAGRAVKGNL